MRLVAPRPRGGNGDPDPAGGLGVALRHVAGALFMTGQDVPDRAVIQRVVGWKDGAARMPEHDLHALEFESFDERFCDGDLHGCFLALVRKNPPAFGSGGSALACMWRCAI